MTKLSRHSYMWWLGITLLAIVALLTFFDGSFKVFLGYFEWAVFILGFFSCAMGLLEIKHNKADGY